MLHWTKIAIFTAGVVAPAILSAQSTNYGSGPVWWNAGQGGRLPWDQTYENPNGQVGIVNRNGAIHTDDHPFFEALGANHRACITCHQPSGGMSVSAASLRQRWKEANGADPVFAAVDGANCPGLPQYVMNSHSLLVERGLFRISLPWPPRTADGAVLKPDFKIDVVRDPTGCNQSPRYGLRSKAPAISVYRRPRIAANLEYVLPGPDGISFMADGREPTLSSQAATAILVHEQSPTPPSAQQLRQIVEFETQIYTAQNSDIRAGLLNEKTGPPLLGPENLAVKRAARLGDTDPASFDVWKKKSGDGDLGVQREFRASVARGSQVFFTRRFRAPEGSGDHSLTTCASCHRAGSRRALDIGTANTTPEDASPDLPLFRITCDGAAPPHPLLGRVFYTQDPGRALITGKCADAGSIVLQQLRALAARAPYFSNGSAKTLRDVVDFYDRRFGIGFGDEEKQDLVNFLSVL